MNKMLNSLLISAVLAMPLIAQSQALTPNPFSKELFLKLRNNEQFTQLVQLAGYKPFSGHFMATEPRCYADVWYTLSDDKNAMVFYTVIRYVTPEESARQIELFERFLAAVGERRFDSHLLLNQDRQNKTEMVLEVSVDDTFGSTTNDVKAAVAQLAEVGKLAYKTHLPN